MAKKQSQKRQMIG